MKNFNFWSVLMLCIVSFVLGIFSTPNQQIGLETGLMFDNDSELCEWAFYRGQKVLLEGDTCIRMLPNGTYTWIRSPWYNGKLPTFNPATDISAIKPK